MNNTNKSNKKPEKRTSFPRKTGSYKKTGKSNGRGPKRRSNFPSKVDTSNYDKAFSLRTLKKKLPAITDDRFRVLTIGGFEEVGQNMFAIENKDSIYIFDAGFQFTSEDDTPGVDYILPNIQYLMENVHKIKALIITHAHLDHIGGIPFLISKLGNPPIYTRNLSSLLIKKRMEEFPNLPKLNITLVEPGDQLKIADTSFEFFDVTHSIPDSMGISVKTPHGNIVVSGDLKLSHVDGVPIEKEQKTWGKMAKEENILMISDSTNCENPGWSIQEPTIQKNVENYIREASSRIIIATFASQFQRMMAFIKAAEDLGKKIVLEGRSVKTNMEIAQKANYYTPKKGSVINVSEINNYPPDQIVIICTGGQGEEFAALPRMSRGDHKYVKLNSRDTIILSSSVIPGNEISVRGLKDQLMKFDLRLLTYKTSDVHSTGHGNAEELAWILKQVKPKYFVPGYGFHSMLKEHKKIAVEKADIPKDNVIVPENGSVIEITSDKVAKMLDIKIPSSPIMVDGYSISDMKAAVLADRKLLSKEGFINIIVLINISKRKLQKSPDILSRGFIYLRESKNMLSEMRSIVSRLAEEEIKNTEGGKIDVERLKEKIHHKVEIFTLKKTNKKPIVMPVVLVA